jgi:hypothetical protein
MPNSALFRWMTVCSVALLVACGGSGGGLGAPIVAAPAAPATVLSVSVAELALAANIPAALPSPIPGNARSMTVTNTGTEPALALTLDASLLPAGTTVTANTCTGTLASLATCTITITPGSNANAVAVTVTLKGSNTNTVSTAVRVLTYGSIYQGGIVFALDDVAPFGASVGGKVTAQTEAAAGPWSPDVQVAAADDLVDGTANTAAILATYGDASLYPSTAVAARACTEFSEAGHTDWYLPAICELGYDQTMAGSGCGTSAAPLVQNVQSNLVDGSLVAGTPGTFWSSTQSGGPGSTVFAWSHHLEGGSTFQVAANKLTSERLLCVRKLN